MKTKEKGPVYTPGPWGLEDEGHLDHEGKIWVVDARGLCVAELEVYADAVIAPDEAEYNARLIAAAPDLLEAVRAMQRAFENYSAEFNPAGRPKNVCDWGAFNADTCKAAAAVRRATKA